MSKYEWEAGTIKIPSADWAKTKATVREAMNRRQTAMLAVAEKVYEELAKKLPELKKQIKAKTIDQWQYDQKLEEIVDRHIKAHEARSSERNLDEYDSSNILRAVHIDRDPKTHQRIPAKLRKPLKKDFPLSGTKVDSFDADECLVFFDNTAKTARWQVHENNHAVERARESVLGQAFFKAMKNVTWTRGSGGQIVGNDEYNRDAGSEYEGGGGHYVTATFSAEQQERDRKSASAYSYGGGYGYTGYGYRR